MARVVVVYMLKPSRARAVQFGPHTVALDEVLIGGAMRKAHVFDPDDPRLRDVRRVVAQMGGMYEISEEDWTTGQLIAPAPAPAAPPPLPALAPAPDDADPHANLPEPVRMALRNGWTMVDLTGAGDDGDWGPKGGYGLRSGLTMAEMALCVPPDNWEALSETKYPWMCDGWRPPGLEFPARTPPPKAPPAPDPTDLPVSDQTAGNVAPDAPQAPLGVDEVDEPGEGDDPTDEKPPADFKAAPGVLESYGEAALQTAARALINELAVADGGKAPSLSKARYHCKKHGLPQPTAAQFAALSAGL